MPEEYIETRINKNTISRKKIKQASSENRKEEVNVKTSIPKHETGKELTAEQSTEWYTERYIENPEIIKNEKNQTDLLKHEDIYRNLLPEDFSAFPNEDLSKTLSPNTFITKMILADKKKVEMKRLEDKNRSIESIIAEKLFDSTTNNNFENAGTFGYNATLYKTTEYDDRFSHTDLVTKWENPLAQENEDNSFLAIDVTTSERQEEIMDKCQKINAELNGMKLTNIKYFNDNKGNTGPLLMIPRVVITVWGDEINNLCKRVHENDLTADGINMSIYLQVKQQLELQIEAINNLLRDQNKTYTPNEINTFEEMIKKIDNIVNIFNNLILQRKKSSLYKTGDEKRASDKIRRSGLEKKYKEYYRAL